MLAGIPQQGAVLGDPKAPVTLVEYADFQCPYCAQWSHGAFPTLVERYVRPGNVRIVFRGLAFLGPDSDRALRTAVAAGRENRLWNVVEALYHRQGHENSGWVTESLLEEVAGPECARPAQSRVGRGADGGVESRSEVGGHPGNAGLPGRSDRRQARARPAELARAGGSRARDRRDAGGVTDSGLRISTAVLALLGAAVAGYLLWVREAGTTLVCATGGCETVQSSTYAEILGVPVALFGLAGYVFILAAALFRGETARLLQVTLSVGAAMFSIYLLYVQMALIGSVCDWCLVSDGIVTALAVLALLRLRLAQAPSSSRPAESA